MQIRARVNKRQRILVDSLNIDEKMHIERGKDNEQAGREAFGHRFRAPDLRERVVGDDQDETIDGGGCKHPRGELSKEEKREDVKLAGERASHVELVLVDAKVAERAQPDDDEIGGGHEREIEEGRVGAQVGTRKYDQREYVGASAHAQPHERYGCVENANDGRDARAFVNNDHITCGIGGDFRRHCFI